MNALSPGSGIDKGKFKVIQTLGQNATSIQYLVQNATLGHYFILNELFIKGFCQRDKNGVVQVQGLPETDFDIFKTQYQEEAKALARISSNGLLKTIDIFEDKNTLYVLKEYKESDSIQTFISNSEIPDETTARLLLKNVAITLGALHEKNLLHSNINPENIYFNNKNEIFLLHPENGKWTNKSGDRFDNFQYTNSNYIPFEQYGKRTHLGQHSDWYALGATFYHLLTGTPPPNAIDRKMESMDSVSELNPEISSNFNDIILKLMEPEIQDRYSDAESLLADLDIPALEEMETPSEPEPEIEEIIDDLPEPVPEIEETIIEDLSKPEEEFIEEVPVEIAEDLPEEFIEEVEIVEEIPEETILPAKPVENKPKVIIPESKPRPEPKPQPKNIGPVREEPKRKLGPISILGILILLALLVAFILFFPLFFSNDGDDEAYTPPQKTEDTRRTEMTNTNTNTKPVQSASEKVVQEFIEAIGQQKYLTAHQLQDNPKWKDYDQFKSINRGYGGISKTKVYETKKKFEIDNEAQVFVKYLAEDAYNDTKKITRLKRQCDKPGVVYEQIFNLKKSGARWKITDSELVKSSCFGRNIYK